MDFHLYERYNKFHVHYLKNELLIGIQYSLIVKLIQYETRLGDKEIGRCL